MTRPRRYLLIAGLLLLAVLLGLSWQLFRMWMPNFFDAEMVDAGELDKVKGATLTTPPAPAGPDWPRFRGPNNDGIASADNFNTDWQAKPPKLTWKTPCGGGYGSVAVAGGRVYVQDRQAEKGNERLLCLSAADGKELWADEYPADYTRFSDMGGHGHGPKATPTIHDGRAYTVGAVGQFCCLKLNGDAKPELLWEHDLMAMFGADPKSKALQWGYAGSPLVEGDLVIVPGGGKGGSVAAFDRVTGEKRWAVGTSMGAYSSPVAATFDGVRQVVAITSESVLGIGVPDGKKLWEYPWVSEPYRVNAVSPLVVGEYVFVSSDYGKGCAVLRVSGDGAKPVYFKPGAKGLKTWHNTAVHRDGFLFGFDSKVLKCMSLRDGTFVADWDAPTTIDKGGMLLVGDKLLVQCGSGTLHLIDADPKEFTSRGSLTGVVGKDSWATPAVLNGRIYTRDGANVVCIDASK